MSTVTVFGEPGLIGVERAEDVAIVRLATTRVLDESNVAQLSEQLSRLVDHDDCKKLLIDFANVEYLSSAALGALINLDKKMRTSAGRLRLCGLDPRIHQVFAVTRLDKIFDIRENQEVALAGF
jgi:anti-sigma B factor antagonist